MPISATLHVPTQQYGYIEVSYSAEELASMENAGKELVEEYKKIALRWAKPNGAGNPTALGQSYTDEFGHLYKSAQNDKTKEFFWMMERV